MIKAAEIRSKAENRYIRYLQDVASGADFERIVIPCNKKPSDDFAVYQAELNDITDNSKERRGYGYTVIWQTVRHKKLGEQDLPKEIAFDTEADFLKFIRKEAEARQFKHDVSSILSAFPVLAGWVKAHPLKVVANSAAWPGLLKVLRYFSLNPRPCMYIRELPIEVHTKFVEQNMGILRELLDIVIAGHINTDEKRFEPRFSLKYDEELIRVRFLDDSLALSCAAGLKDISLPVSQFCAVSWKVQSVFIVENKVNFLTFPPVTNALIIWGHGYGVASLKAASFLAGTPLYYWGDLDAQGFEILSQFRGYFPQTRSILMDSATFTRFFENDEGKPSKVSADLNLTDEENSIYQTIKANNWRLEQEKIPQSYVVEYIKELFNQ